MGGKNWICFHCGLQYAEQDAAPPCCLNCSNERESMTHKPPRWTHLAEMAPGYHNIFTALGDGVTGICTDPAFGIGPEIFFIQTSAGNVLWDCLAYVDRATIEQLRNLGGVSAIIISHPHMFGSVVDWSRDLGNIPVFTHQDNQPWMPRPDPAIHWWQGESFPVNSELTILRCGGHFPGSSVLHWRSGAGGKGALFTGDTILPVEDRRWVSFMYSYPNLIPISRRAVENIVNTISGIEFDRIYGGPMYGSGGGRPIIQKNAKDAVLRSAARYIHRLDS